MSKVVAATLEATTLEEATSGLTVPVATVVAGSGKAWWAYNQITPAILDSFNIASITDTGTGNYTVNFDVDMPNDNYAVAVWVKYNTTSYAGIATGNSVSTKTGAQLQVLTSNGGTLVDVNSTGVTFSGTV